jgi:hypothetical protein
MDRENNIDLILAFLVIVMAVIFCIWLSEPTTPKNHNLSDEEIKRILYESYQRELNEN